MKRNFLRASSLALAVAFMLLTMLSATSCKDASGEEKDKYFSFTDALGREVSLSSPPLRVAAMLGSFADVWSLAGGELCATADDAWEDFDLDLPNAVNIGGAHSPSLELLISADPDFVLASASTASNLNMRDTLEAMGITVAYFDVDCFDDYLNMLKICSQITEREDLYIKNGLEIKEKIELIKNAYANADIAEEERKILLLRASSSFVKAKGSEGTILGEMLADMGCVNIADGESGLLENLSVEAVIKNEPRHIFAVSMGSDTQAAINSLENMIKENPAWSELDAVKNGRLHVMDKTLFNLKPNARWAESYQILYEKLIEE